MTVTETPPVATPRAAPAGNPAVARAVRRGVLALATAVLSILVLYFGWLLFLKVLDISPFVGKKPSDVWTYLFNSDDAKVNRSALLDGLGITLKDGLIGFVFGVGGAVIVAALFAVFAPLEFMFMPLALIFRSIPLIAVAPLIGIIFGRGFAGAAAIGGIVVFFPVLVNVAIGLRATSPQSLDLIRVNGGTKWTALQKVALPTALPNFMAAVRISVPAAVTGAMLYEWLFSGKGLGSQIITAPSQLDYNLVWSIAVLVTLVSILIYSLVGILEAALLTKWGPNAGRA